MLFWWCNVKPGQGARGTKPSPNAFTRVWKIRHNISCIITLTSTAQCESILGWRKTSHFFIEQFAPIQNVMLIKLMKNICFFLLMVALVTHSFNALLLWDLHLVCYHSENAEFKKCYTSTTTQLKVSRSASHLKHPSGLKWLFYAEVTQSMVLHFIFQ